MIFSTKKNTPKNWTTIYAVPETRRYFFNAYPHPHPSKIIETIVFPFCTRESHKFTEECATIAESGKRRIVDDWILFYG